jgi:hypothetical protein
MRGIYIIEEANDRVTGFRLSYKGGRAVVQRFTRCTLAQVTETARSVIEDPQIYWMRPTLCVVNGEH